MKPLWKLRSGKFAGFNDNGTLYDAKGRHIGYFIDKIAVGCDGKVVGEMYDNEFIGYCTNSGYSLYGVMPRLASIGALSYGNYGGQPIAGWDDPHF